jgi:two-component system response regulator DevR
MAPDQNGRIRLFHVEDNDEMRSRIDRELAGIRGVELVGHSGKAPEAIREIRRSDPDLVVLDLQLSEGSGLDVLKSLRPNPRKPVVIVLTNLSDATSRGRSLRAGARYFFDKSTEFDQFLGTLSTLSDKS